MTLVRNQTQTTRSEHERTTHEATTPPTKEELKPEECIFLNTPAAGTDWSSDALMEWLLVLT